MPVTVWGFFLSQWLISTAAVIELHMQIISFMLVWLQCNESSGSNDHWSYVLQDVRMSCSEIHVPVDEQRFVDAHIMI